MRYKSPVASLVSRRSDAKRSILGTLGSFPGAFCLALDGIGLEQVVMRTRRFNDRAVSGKARAAVPACFQYRVRERFKKTMAERALAHDDKTSNVGMIRHDSTSDPHAPQARQSLGTNRKGRPCEMLVCNSRSGGIPIQPMRECGALAMLSTSIRSFLKGWIAFSASGS
ncbi:MAG: hypothetical protein FWH15_05845 [Betaproteobacteria bacterium]|nr:hypothetical protein [Betaproteobacteria bacterium]